MAEEGEGTGEGAGEGTGEGAAGAAAGWRDNLDAGVRDHPALAVFDGVPALAQGFLETKELVGRKGIILPKDGDDGDRARFRTEIGVPGSPEEYQLGDFKPPEGLPWSDGFQTAMLKRCHEIGIPNGQIRELLDGYAEVQCSEYTSLVDAQSKGHENGTAALREELGVDYNASIELSQRAFKAAVGDNFDAVNGMVLADGTRLCDHPDFIRTFIAVGKQYREAGLHGETTGGAFTKTPESAKQEIAELESNPALYNADHPEHDLIVARKNELYEMAYPESTPEVS